MTKSERTCYEFDKAPARFERLRLCKECYSHVTLIHKGGKRKFCSIQCKWAWLNKDGKSAARVRKCRDKAGIKDK